MREMVDLIIRGGMVIPIDSEMSVLPATDIAVANGCIAAIGPNLAITARREIDARDHAVLPGLVNAHMHETLTRGACEDLPLDRWLAEVCFPLDRSYTPEAMYASALMNQAEMIRGGITTFLDIYRHPSACAKVTLRSGLRGIFAPQIISDPPLIGESVDSAAAFVEAWLGRSPRVIPAFGPHAPYSCTPEDLHRIASLAEKYGVPIHTHLAETRWEVQVIRDRYGLSPTGYLDAHGILGSRTSVAHGVQLTPGEIAILQRRGVGVVYNPTSNMKLASGIAPIPALLAAGVTVALGTDSNLSNNNLDLWEEMRLGSLLQKLYCNDASAPPCKALLRMATLEGARALGLDSQIGSLEPGKQADLIFVDLNQPHLWPLLEGQRSNLVEQLVYSANAADVTHTIVAGQVLMEDRHLQNLDLGEARLLVQVAARKMMASAELN